jgi:hypothetical protein
MRLRLGAFEHDQATAGFCPCSGRLRDSSNQTVVAVHENRAGLNWWLQHWLAVYSRDFESPNTQKDLHIAMTIMSKSLVREFECYLSAL